MTWEPELESRDLGSVDRMTGVYTGNMAKDYRNMTLLSDTMTVIAGSADVEDLVEEVVDRLYTTLKPDHVGIFDWDGEGEPLLVAGLTRRPAANGGQEAASGLALSHRKAALLEDARRERKAFLVSYSDDDSERRILSFAVPLLVNDLCLGCLYLDGREETVALEGSADLGFLRAFAPSSRWLSTARGSATTTRDNRSGNSPGFAPKWMTCGGRSSRRSSYTDPARWKRSWTSSAGSHPPRRRCS
jgi:transcriptional regulator with GAF, ATPase, and Fis domain